MGEIQFDNTTVETERWTTRKHTHTHTRDGDKAEVLFQLCLFLSQLALDRCSCTHPRVAHDDQ